MDIFDLCTIKKGNNDETKELLMRPPPVESPMTIPMVAPALSLEQLNKILDMNPHIKQQATPVSDEMIKHLNLKRPIADKGIKQGSNPKRRKTDANTNKFQQHKPSMFFMQPFSKDYDFENREFAELIHNDAYINYKPAKLQLGLPHNYTVVESRSLMSAEVPDITYTLKMPQKIINEGMLSNVQLEAVIYACQKHEENYFDEKRLGFLIGDGAGVGKGRTISGIILENYLAGRKKSIWISISTDLKQDAIRDLGDVCSPIGVDIKVGTLSKMSYNKIDSKENGFFNEGVLFLSYSSMIAKSKNMERNQFQNRLHQIVDWFGKDYDGIIIFDECHKAKNLQQKKKTQTGSIAKKLQDELKNARVVYSSATGASEPKHMAYMTRLGLWGPGKRFATFEDFESSLTSLGVGAMELLAIEMKTKGIYLARQLSFQGVEFEIQELSLEEATINGHRFKDVYNKCVKVWNSVYEEFYNAFQRNRTKEKEENVFEAQYWSAHQRFFKYLCIAGKMEQCVKITKKAIKDKCVVIGIQTTGEAQTMEMLEESVSEINEFVSSAKGVIKNLIENHYPSASNLSKYRERIKLKNKAKSKKFYLHSDLENFYGGKQKHETILIDDEDDEDDDVVIIDDEHIPLVSTKDDSLLDKERKQRMLKAIEDIETMFPFNTLDQLIKELGGPDKVAEMTGRKGRMLQNKGLITYQSRKELDIASDQINLLEKERFNNGQKSIAIISDAASTGISLHSDVRFANKKQRLHITLELPWSADKAIQQFGRTHRSNQVVSPHYLFLISDLAGERRFASTIAKRLESMGALTHGDRRCGNNRDLGQFNCENEFGQRAVYHLMQYINKNECPQVPFPVKYMHLFRNDQQEFCRVSMQALKNVGLSEKNITVPKFLNRILGIEVDLQNALFQYFLDIIENESSKSKARNDFDYGIRDIQNENDTVYVEETVIFNERSRNDDEIIHIHKIINVDDGISWEKAFKRYQLNPHNNMFCVSNHFENLFLALAEYKSQDEYTLITPNFPEKQISKTLLESMWQMKEVSDICNDWDYVYKQSKTRCLHEICNESCPKRFCVYGNRTKTTYLITGAVFTAFKLIGSVIRKCSISRVELHDGRKLVGAMVSPPYYKAVMTTLESTYHDLRCDRFDIPYQLQDSLLICPSPVPSVTSTSSKSKGQKTQGSVRFESLKSKKNKGLPLSGVSLSRINDQIAKQFKRPEKPSKPLEQRPNFPKPLNKERIVTEIKLNSNFNVQIYQEPKP